jgi:hypothetical protein
MTVARLVSWTLVWLGGWALFLIHPAAHSSLGSVLLLAVAPLIMLTPRQWKEDAPSRGAAIVLILLVFLFLLVVFVLPPSYTWQFPGDPRLVLALKVFGLLVAVFGIGVAGRRFVHEQAGAA